MEEYGSLIIKVKVSKENQKEKESEVFNSCTELFSEIEELINSPVTKKKYPLLKIETEEPF